MTIAINLMMLGSTGSGKTTFIHNFVYSLPRMPALGRSWEGKIVEIRHKIVGVNHYNPFNLETGKPTEVHHQYTFAFSREWVGEKQSEIKSEIEEHRFKLKLADNPGGDVQNWLDGNGKNKDAITIGDKFKSADGVIAIISPESVLNMNGERAEKLLEYVKTNRTAGQFLAICYNHAKLSSDLPLDENDFKELINKYFSHAKQQNDPKLRNFIVPSFQDKKLVFQEAALSPFFWILDQRSEVTANASWSLG